METAVEWLVEQLKEYKHLSYNEQSWIFKQAKKMEKEQICNAYKEGNHSEMRGGKFINPIAEQYYNETFKSE